MSLAETFRSQRAVVALATLLTAAVPFHNAAAQDPVAAAPTTSIVRTNAFGAPIAATPTSQMMAANNNANTRLANIPSTAGADSTELGPLAKAAKYSTEGIGFYFVQGKDDNYDYKPLLSSLRQGLLQVDKVNKFPVPNKIYGGQSDKPGTYIVFIAKGVTFTGKPVGTYKDGELGGYTPDDIRNGVVSYQARKIYEQAFLDRSAANTPAPASTTLASTTLVAREP
jgi:hypothetical protein